uniref:Ribosomal protein L16 n=1 Tax=Prototheca wickerhamii TaxID=3111 RepID=A0A873HVZ6_PROWI|nr:ribosomal protein L16 [Prototheca wickerhamii]
MLQPKNTKFRKFQKSRVKGIESNTNQLRFGQFGIKTTAAARIPARTIEAVRRVITRKFRRLGVIWIRVFPDISVTEKPAEVRMGKGKGSPQYWVCKVKRGTILFEFDGVTPQLAKQAARLADSKLPVKTRFITYS